MANPILYDPVTFNNENELNVIIDERVKFDREYIILDKIKIHDAIEDPDTLLTIFTDDEMNVLFKQAFEMDYLNQNYLITNFPTVTDNMIQIWISEI